MRSVARFPHHSDRPRRQLVQAGPVRRRPIVALVRRRGRTTGRRSARPLGVQLRIRLVAVAEESQHLFR